MWTTRFVACVLLLCGPALVQAQAPSPGSPDETAVRDLVARYVAARELRDPKAVEALFTADADQYTTSGDWRRGQAQIVTGTARSSAQNPGIRRIRVEAVRFVTADVAIADGPYEITASDGRGADATDVDLDRGGASSRRVADHAPSATWRRRPAHGR